jgi:arylsulfatase A-like enzyme
MTLALAVRLIAVSAALGAGCGLPAALRLMGAGFPAVGLAELRAPVVTSLLLGTLGVAVFAMVERRVSALGGLRATILATFVAAAGAWAWIGVTLNRQWAIRPQEVLSGYSLRRNGALLLGLVGATLILSFLVHRWRARPTGAGLRLSVGLGLSVAALLASPALLARRAATGGPPPVLVLLVDALRADGLGVYGNSRPTSPILDQLARDGVVFEQAVAASTFTRTSVASLFTGKIPLRHGVYWGGRAGGDGVPRFHLLGAQHRTLAEAFRERRYLTQAWVQNSQILGAAGFAQGFLEYRDQQGSQERIHRRLLPWLAGPGGRTPFFLYVHYIDLHDPYRPKPPDGQRFGATDQAYAGLDLTHWGRTLEEIRSGKTRLSNEQLEQQRRLYDGQIVAIDRGIGELLETLKASGIYDRALIAVVADHGDAFGEHGFISHSSSPYDELLRVPFLLKLPQQRWAGTRIREQVRLIDLYPTLLELSGGSATADGSEAIDGCSLVPLLRGEPRRSPTCAIAVAEIDEEGERPTMALRTAEWKYIDGRRGPELYDLAADPAETKNLAGDRPEDIVRLAGLARELSAQRGQAGETTAADEALLRELRNLGYLK